MNTKNYKIIQTKQDLIELDNLLTTNNFELLAVDTETNGLAFYRDVIIGFSISWSKSEGIYVPLLNWSEGVFWDQWRPTNTHSENVTSNEYKPPQFIRDYLKKWLLDSKAQLLLHNAPFDILFIEKNFDINLTDKLFCDTLLLKHILDENTSCGLKETAILWQKELGIPADQLANQEQIEMGASVIKNGGKFSKGRGGQKHIWRADLEVLGRYAIMDTCLTYGLFEVGMAKFESEYEEKHFKWFFEDEVMPLCREVVIPMKRQGMTIDVPYFQLLKQQTDAKLLELEDNILDTLTKQSLLVGFEKGKSIDKVANKKRLIKVLAKIEDLKLPTLPNGKVSLRKDLVQKAYAENNHWLLGYVLGEKECPYSNEELNSLKAEIFKEETGRRYSFNINSPIHLQWLFCDKLKNDASKLPQTPASTKAKPRVSLDAETLEAHFVQKYTWVELLLTWKRLKKLASTYIDAALELQYNGVLYVDMFQNGTVSGRFSCGGGYNLQTLPRAEDLTKCPACGGTDIKVEHDIEVLANLHCNTCKKTYQIICPSIIKKGFIAPEGMNIIAADYQALEPRLFAEVSTDQRLKDIFLKGWDFYSTLYCASEGKESGYSGDPAHPKYLKKVAKEIRDGFKGTALAVPYGARKGQVANLRGYKKTAFTYDGTKYETFDFDKGQRFIDNYFKSYPDLHNFILKQHILAHTQGWIETFVGRRRHFQFAPKVFKILCDAGISYEEFLDAKNKDLSTMNYAPGMGKQVLMKLLAEMNISHWDQTKKRERDWLFIRSMYKLEINTSVNFMIQGAAAHVCNRGMLEMTREFKNKKLNGIISLQVHDDVTTYVSKEDTDRLLEIQQDRMENNMYAKMIEIPLLAEPQVGLNLKETK